MQPTAKKAKKAVSVDAEEGDDDGTPGKEKKKAAPKKPRPPPPPKVTEPTVADDGWTLHPPSLVYRRAPGLPAVALAPRSRSPCPYVNAPAPRQKGDCLRCNRLHRDGQPSKGKVSRVVVPDLMVMTVCPLQSQ